MRRPTFAAVALIACLLAPLPRAAAQAAPAPASAAVVAPVSPGRAVGHPFALGATQPVTIALAAPFSGGVASFGQQQLNSAHLAIDPINAAGGIDIGGSTYTVTLAAEDDACSGSQAVIAATAALAARAAIVIGHTCSGASIEAAPVYQAAGVPMLSPTSTSPDLTAQGNSFVFRLASNDGLLPSWVAQVDFDRGLTRAALLTYGDPGFTSDFATKYTSIGGTVVVSQTLSTASDLTTALNAVAASTAQIVITFDGDYEGTNAAGVSAAAFGRNMPQAIAWFGVGDLAAYITHAGLDAAEGDFFIADVPPTYAMAGWARFAADYTAAAFPTQPDPSDLGALTYDAVKIALDAMVRAGSVDPGNIRDALAGLTHYEGVVGAYQGFESNGDASPQRPYMGVVKHGTWVPAELRAGFYPAEGGALKLGPAWGQATSFTFPPGASEQPLDVFLSTAPASSYPAPLHKSTVGGYIVHIEANQSLSKPVTCTVTYSDADLAGRDESSLELYTWNGGTSSWQPANPCGGYVRDLNGNVLQIPLCHFSLYELVADAKAYLPFVVKQKP